MNTRPHEEAPLSLKQVAVEMNNVALCFHEGSNLGVAAAIYTEALEAIRELSCCPHDNNGQGGVAASKRWKTKLIQRKNLLQIYGSHPDPAAACFLEEVFSPGLKPILLEANELCTDDMISCIILHNMGMSHIELGQTDLAIKCLTSASSYGGASNHYSVVIFMSVHYVLGVVHGHRGRLRESVAEMMTALRIGDGCIADDCEKMRSAITSWLALISSETTDSNVRGAVDESTFPFEDDAASPAA